MSDDPSALVIGRRRGKALPWSTPALPAVDENLLLWTLAVREDGARAADAPVVDEERARVAAARDDVVVVLGHAGPEASRWREARAIAAADVPSASTGRRPSALDAEGWRDVIASFSRAAEMCSQGGVGFVLVDASDDGLLAGALSPLSFPGVTRERRRAPLLEVVKAVRGRGLHVGVLLTVEDLAPGGLDPTAGIEAAKACEGAGSSLFVARAGSAWFEDLRSRPRSMGDDEAWLASALWLVPHVAAPVYAAGPVVDAKRALSLATQSGLAGVITWKVEGPPP